MEPNLHDLGDSFNTLVDEYVSGILGKAEQDLETLEQKLVARCEGDPRHLLAVFRTVDLLGVLTRDKQESFSPELVSRIETTIRSKM